MKTEKISERMRNMKWKETKFSKKYFPRLKIGFYYIHIDHDLLDGEKYSLGIICSSHLQIVIWICF